MRPLALVLLALLLGCAGSRSAQVTTTSTTTTSTTTTTTTAPTTTTTVATVAPAPVTPAHRPLAALGDSQLYEAADDLTDLLPPDSVEIHASVGMPTDDAHYGLGRLLANEPDALLVVLGANDVGDGTFGDDDRDAIDALASRMGTVPCVRWVDLATVTPSSAYNDAATEFNAFLRRAARTWGFEVVAWSDEIRDRPDWLRADGLHHTSEGQAALAALAVAALDGCDT